MGFDEEEHPMDDYYTKAAEARNLIVEMRNALSEIEDSILARMQSRLIVMDEHRKSAQDLVSTALEKADVWLKGK